MEGRVRMVLLCSTACLGGVADSVMSPFLCPELRQRGLSSTACGLLISARFATQIIFLLVFGGLMQRLGAVRLFLASAAAAALFNCLLATAVLVRDNNPLFLAVCLTFLVLSTVGDAGIFCSVYMLARQAGGGGAAGPAWVETCYAAGSMLGPPLGGLLYPTGGFGLVILAAGLSMAPPVLAATLAYWPPTGDTAQQQAVDRQETVRKTEKKDEPVSPVLSNCGIKTIELSPVCDEKDKNQNNSVNPSISRMPGEARTGQGLVWLCTPVLLACCLAQVTSGLSSSWHLSALQAHLTTSLSLSPGQAGWVYMIPGLLYMLLTPGTGRLLDVGCPHLPLLALAGAASLVAHLLLALSRPPGLATTLPALALLGISQVRQPPPPAGGSVVVFVSHGSPCKCIRC